MLRYLLLLLALLVFACGSPTGSDEPLDPVPTDSVVAKFIQTCVGGCPSVAPVALAKLVAEGVIETRPDTILVKEDTRSTLEIINRSTRDLYIRSIVITNSGSFTTTSWAESSTWGTIDTARPLTLVPNSPRDNQIEIDYILSGYENSHSTEDYSTLQTDFREVLQNLETQNTTYLTYHFHYFDDEGLRVEVTEVDSIILNPQYLAFGVSSLIIFDTDSLEASGVEPGVPWFCYTYEGSAINVPTTLDSGVTTAVELLHYIGQPEDTTRIAELNETNTFTASYLPSMPPVFISEYPVVLVRSFKEEVVRPCYDLVPGLQVPFATE